MSLRLPEDAQDNITSLVSTLESKLRDPRHFGGSPPLENPSASSAPAGERWSDVVKVSCKASEPREPPSGSAVSSSAPLRHSLEEPENPGKRKRHKKNKGQARRTWQDNAGYSC